MNNINGRLLNELKNSFTYEFRVKPDNVHFIDKQTPGVPAKMNGKNYVIGPGHGVNSDESGVSVSVGFNGITVYEHTKNKTYAVLVHEMKINNITHITVVYENKVPFLYVNGEYIKKGEGSKQKYVYPSGVIGNEPGLFFNGTIQEIRIWNYSLTNQQIKNSLNHKLDGSEEGLFGVWPELPKTKIKKQIRISENTTELPKTKIEKEMKISQNTTELPKTKKEKEMKISQNTTELPKTKIEKEMKISPNTTELPKTKIEKDNKISQNITERPKTKIEKDNEISPNTTELQKAKIKKDMKISQNTTEQHLPKNDKQEIEVSIIIPSHNKYPLNLFTLYSLEEQTFNQAKMEVIMIDDCSTDQTQQAILNFQPTYHFKYIRSKKHLGRSKTRNLGIKAAKGQTLIFLDAEMMVEPDFVEKHQKYHQSNDNIIATGVMHFQPIYTCVFPEFNKKVIDKITNLTNKSISQNSKEVIPLIDREDITNQAYKNLVYKKSNWFQPVIKQFGSDLQEFEFPWMAFLTGNVSIRKAFIERAGCFDEEFVNYGYEDWELGYRLYKMGAKFIAANDLRTYHQEHPVAENKWMEAVGNYGLFTLKHYEIDTLILSLEMSLAVDLIEMSKILSEYKHLIANHSEKFPLFQDRFIDILETIILFLNVDIRHINILGATGFGSEQITELSNDVNNIKELKEYKNLTNLLEKIMSESVSYSVGV